MKFVYVISIFKLEPQLNGPFTPDLGHPISRLAEDARKNDYPLDIKVGEFLIFQYIYTTNNYHCRYYKVINSIILTINTEEVSSSQFLIQFANFLNGLNL